MTILLETGEWMASALLLGAIVFVWGSLALLRWSRPKTRRWNGREVV